MKIKMLLIMTAIIATLSPLHAFKLTDTKIYDYAKQMEFTESIDSTEANMSIFRNLEVIETLTKKRALSKTKAQAVEIDRMLASKYSNVGFAFFLLGQQKVSHYFYEKAHLLDPNDLGRTFDYAHGLINTGYYNDGLALMKELIKKEPENEMIWVGIADAYFKAGQLPEAITRCDEAIKKFPKTESANYAFIQKMMQTTHLQNAFITPKFDELESLNLIIWPGQFIGLISGKISEETFIEILKSEDEATQRKRLCEVMYYLGELNLGVRNTETAKRYFQKTIECKVDGFEETYSAKKRLKEIFEKK